VHTTEISGAFLAGMSARSKGGGGPASSDVQGSGTRGEASEPIGSQFQFSPLNFEEADRRVGRNSRRMPQDQRARRSGRQT
jgi:hypothetical protein